MAFPRRGGSPVSAPRIVTLVLSLVLVGLALLSFTPHLPEPLALVRVHRFAVLALGYGVLLAGVLLPGV